MTCGASASRSARTRSSIPSRAGWTRSRCASAPASASCSCLPPGIPATSQRVWLEQVAEQLDEYLRRGYAVVLVTPAGDPAAARQREALGGALAAIGHPLPPGFETDGDADALEAYLRAQPVPGVTA